MLITIALLALLYLAGVFTLAGALWRAPEGFEDDEGFHACRQSSTDELR